MAIDFRLIAVSDRRLCAPASLAEYGEILATHGCKALLLRERDLDEPSYLQLADDVRDRVRGTSLRVIVHGQFGVAAALAPPLHLRESQIERCRQIRLGAGPAAIIGASTHSVERALAAQSGGASYVVFGPVFDTPSKRQYGPPVGVGRLATACQALSIPVFAIGGINPKRTVECLRHGAYGVACISALLPTAHTAQTLREFERELGQL